MGHFLHIPFPSLDMLSMLPWAAQLVDALTPAVALPLLPAGLAGAFDVACTDDARCATGVATP